MPKVYNRRSKEYPKDAVYVGRPGPYGNPYTIGRDGSREEVVEKFRSYTREAPASYIEGIVKDLRGKDLVCWCAPEACHADILLAIANAPAGQAIMEIANEPKL